MPTTTKTKMTRREGRRRYRGFAAREDSFVHAKAARYGRWQILRKDGKNERSSLRAGT
jgi:hypothetical protein